VADTGAVLPKVSSLEHQDLILNVLEDLDSDFVCLWGKDFDVLDAQGLLGFPGDGRLTVDDLQEG
jgi:hypothetical protein